MRYKNLFKLHCDKLKEFQKQLNNATTKEAIAKVQDKEKEYLLSVFDIMKEYNENVSQNKQNELLYRYLKITCPNYTKPDFSLSLNNQKCKDCEQYYDSIEGFDVCSACGKCVQNIHLASTLSYKEIQEIDYKPHFFYEKETHLSDWLSRFQSRENKVIPVEVLDVVKVELRKERITDYTELNEAKVKKILKGLKLNEYYDNVINIINRLSGRPSFVLTSEVNDKIKQMFAQIQHPFQLYKPPHRKNFLSYSYFLNKFFLILKLPEFSKYFPLLKSDEKLRQQDEIFEKIVKHMKIIDDSVDWKFYPSF